MAGGQTHNKTMKKALRGDVNTSRWLL